MSHDHDHDDSGRADVNSLVARLVDGVRKFHTEVTDAGGEMEVGILLLVQAVGPEHVEIAPMRFSNMHIMAQITAALDHVRVILHRMATEPQAAAEMVEALTAAGQLIDLGDGTFRLVPSDEAAR